MKQFNLAIDILREYARDLVKKSNESLRGGEFIHADIETGAVVVSDEISAECPETISGSLDVLQEWMRNRKEIGPALLFAPFASGKSTFLRQLVCMEAERIVQQGPLAKPPYVLFFDLAGLSSNQLAQENTASTGNSEDGADLVKFREMFNRLLWPSCTTEVNDALLSCILDQIRQGSVICCFDSLDEALLKSNLQEAQEFTRGLLTIPRCRISDRSKAIVAMRTEWVYGLATSPLRFFSSVVGNRPGFFRYFCLRGFSKLQMHQYIISFFEKAPNVQRRQDKEVLQKLLSERWLWQLGKTPLHLWMLCNLSPEVWETLGRKNEKNMHGRQTELFESFVAFACEETEKIFKIKLNMPETFWLLARGRMEIENPPQCPNLSEFFKSAPNRLDERLQVEILRKVALLRVEREGEPNPDIQFIHKSFAEYFFSDYVAYEIEKKNNFGPFDKVALDIEARTFLVGRLGFSRYLKLTRHGWGLPDENYPINSEDSVRQEIAKFHREFINAAVNPFYLGNKDKQEEWHGLCTLIDGAIDHIYVNPLVIRSVRYGIIVLSQVIESGVKWEAKWLKDNRAFLVHLTTKCLREIMCGDVRCFPKSITAEDDLLRISPTEEMMLLFKSSLQCFGALIIGTGLPYNLRVQTTKVIETARQMYPDKKACQDLQAGLNRFLHYYKSLPQ